MRIGIFGATGFIGGALMRALRARGDEVVGFSRRAKGEGWRTSEGALDLSGLNAVINLAGESVACRWTASRKERFQASRIGLTERIVQALGELSEQERPRILLNSSAVGYYGAGGEESLSEEWGPGEGYLADLCRDWEKAAGEASGLGVRVVLLRTGIVLGLGGEAWEKMARAFRWGGGGRLGSGQQWMPWIHVSDEVGAILLLLDHEEATGAVNLVAPEPVRNATWTTCLAHQLRRPAVVPVPGWVLRVLLGGFGDALLASQRVVPGRLGALGYRFAFPDLSTALQDLTKGEDQRSSSRAASG